MRDAVIAALLGSNRAADIWYAGLRLPNVLQNLLGEGTLSASFIPVYARMLEEGREEEAGRFAGAILGILIVVAYGGALVGIALAPWIAQVVAFGPGWVAVRMGIETVLWEPEAVETLAGVLRILFPMTATLVVSAWALGVLNTHRRFFLSYVAPVFWNVAIIAAGVSLLVAVGPATDGGPGNGAPESAFRLVRLLAFGALVGGVLQLVVQLPTVARLLTHFRVSLGRGVAGVREAIRNFVPVVTARGVVNLSAFVDIALAAALVEGAISLIARAQTFYLLPISLFGMAIAASELPELSRSGPEGREAVALRVRRALERVGFLLLPSTVAYLVLGDLFVAALYERGAFGATDAAATGWVLAAYALGLWASGSSRTLSSAFYALRDTKTPAVAAIRRVVVSLVVGGALMFPLDDVRIGEFGLGAVGLALGASAGAWVEYLLLRRALRRRVGDHAPAAGRTLRMLVAAGVAGGAGFAARRLLVPVVEGIAARLEAEGGAGAAIVAFGGDHLVLAGCTALVLGGVYLGLARALGVHRHPA